MAKTDVGCLWQIVIYDAVCNGFGCRFNQEGLTCCALVGLTRPLWHCWNMECFRACSLLRKLFLRSFTLSPFICIRMQWSLLTLHTDDVPWQFDVQIVILHPSIPLNIGWMRFCWYYVADSYIDVLTDFIELINVHCFNQINNMFVW